MFERYIKGEAEVQEARAQVNRLRQKSTLSKADRGILEGSEAITRRHFLRRARDIAMVGSVVIAGGGFLLFKQGSESEQLEPDPQKADHIRDQLRSYEQNHFDQVNSETVTTIFELTSQLYAATFGRQIAETKLLIDTAVDARKRDPTIPVHPAPRGNAGLIIWAYDQQGKAEKFAPGGILIYLGDPEKTDASVNKLSVIRAVMLHELVHAQAIPRPLNTEETVAGETFNAPFVRAFKWSIVNEAHIEKGWYLEEIAAQLLAEYVNDPTGKDDIWNRINASPLYSKSFSQFYFPGVVALREIIDVLGISIAEVEKAHFTSNPKVLLERMDSEIAKREIAVSRSAAHIFINQTVNNSNNDPQKVYVEPVLELRDAIIKHN